MKNARLLPLVLLMTACVHAPSYKEVTPEGDNAFVVSRDSVEPFGSDDEVERVARDYCAASSQVYRQLKRDNYYITRGSDEVHRVVLHFQCAPAAAASAAGD